MDIDKAMKKLAQSRLAERSRTTYGLDPSPEGSSSQADLLKRMCKNLPASQQAQCKIFEDLFRQNSHSPEFATRTSKRHSTMPFIKQRSTVTSEDSSLTIHHYQNLFEIDLIKLSNSQDFIYNVFVGGLSEANDEGLLIQNEINGIITIGSENDPQKYAYIKNGYLLVPKFEQGFIKKTLKAAYTPLEAMLHKGKVLIHSRDGHILAPSLLIAFLMKKYNLLFTSAKEIVLTNHPQILIPSDLESQLKKVNH